MRRPSLIACVIAVVWFAAIVTFWASRPIHDEVPTGVVNGAYTSQPIECASPWSRSSGRPDVLPTLGTVPTNTGPVQLAYQRQPCDEPHSEARLLLWIDAGLLGLVLIGAVAIPMLVRRRSLEVVTA
jgi:hypothetical protein